MKDDSGSYAVFTEQGSSASQMTAAKVMDIISRLPGCSGQAADAVSAHTQVKIGRCSQIVQNSQVGMSRHIGFVYQSTNGPNRGPVWKTQSFLSSEICTVILWKDYYGRGNSRKVLLTYGWEKVPLCECFLVNREKDYSCLCSWTI